MNHVKYWFDWLFRDLTKRRGGYVIAQSPNASLIVFIISMMFGIVLYPGIIQHIFIALAYLALGYWSYAELTSGHSRFRKLLGIFGLCSVVLAIVSRLGF